MMLLSVLCVLSFICGLEAFAVAKPKALSVNCKSRGNGEEFKQRLKWRENAEDHTTIWLFKGEELTIHFELATDADVNVLNVVYSNDGDVDLISLILDGSEIGRFKTKPWHGWGYLWNEFDSSGPVGGVQKLKAGKHDFTLKILDSDQYGIEIDYIRLNVQGGRIERLGKDDFLCVHTPTISQYNVDAKESLNPVVYRFKYFNSSQDDRKDGVDEIDGNAAVGKLDNARRKSKQEKKPRVKSFLEPDETTFAQIRRKLSTLSLTTEYKKDAYSPPPMFNERKYAPRRISSLNSKDGKKLGQRKRKGLASRESFRSDEHEYRIFQTGEFDSPRKLRSTENEGANKFIEGVITPRQHPELFSQQIKALEKSHTSRITSPKSSRSVDSSGKMHLGLIETLDLNEPLNDLEKIKQRYSSDYFTKSLSLYKLRGHDRCFNRSGMTEHIPRGTRLFSPDSMRPGSKLSLESAQTMSSITTPYTPRSTNVRLTPMVLPHHYMQDTDTMHIHGFQQATPMKEEENGGPPTDENKDTRRRRRKSVGFNMVPTEANENDVASNASSPRESIGKELKSILKKKAGTSKSKNVEIQEKEGDDFHANPNYYWKFQLPRLQSPAPAAKVRQASQFRKKMYHYGQGISDEFEQVINRYGNCRQNSMVRDPSIIRENSSHVT